MTALSRRDFIRASAAAGGALTLGCRQQPAPRVTPDALALHLGALVIDLHVDSFLWVRLLGYDMGRRHENRLPASPFGWHADLPRLAAGGVGGVGFGIVVNPRQVRPELMLPLKVLSWFERLRGFEAVLKTLDLMHDTARRYPAQLAVVRNGSELRFAHLAGKVAGLPCLEGAHGLEGSLDNVRTAHARGLRSIGLVHFQASEAGYPMTVAEFDGQGLTNFGRELIGEMERLRMLVDLAHLNDAGFSDALAVMKRPFMVSHTGCRAVYAHRRNLTDEQIRAVADRGGVLGIVFERGFVSASGADLERVLDHFDHAIKVGGEDAVGIGSDYDGFITPAAGLEDVTAMPRLTTGLLARGHGPATVRKVLGENAVRVITEVCG
ncbi:MAG: dipeptidase [Deltaproteobacteria bacterium]|nr:dipeptidase [Deltaproteobacteria bacterium]